MILKLKTNVQIQTGEDWKFLGKDWAASIGSPA